MPFSLPETCGVISREIHCSPSAWLGMWCGGQRETHSLPWRGAEQHTGKHPRCFALAARDHSTAAAQRPRGVGPNAQQSAPTRRAVPRNRKVEGWGPSSHKVPMREAQASLAPRPAVINHAGSAFVSLKDKIP